MTNNTQTHVGERSAQEILNKETTSLPLHTKSTEDSYEVFPPTDNNNNRSPNFPWLMEYWSSSLCRAPEMVIDNLCACQSAADPYESLHAASSTESKRSYFDDTILRSDPKVERTPTKISPSRWDALRAVVASQGDIAAEDYCDIYERSIATMPSAEETKEDLTTMDTSESIYPIKPKKTKTRSLMDDTKEDEDMEIEDEIREGPSSSEQELHTCHSFDQYIVEPSRRYFCPTPSTPVRPPIGAALSPPAARLPDRRRMRQASQISPRTLGFLGLPTGQRLTPPSPAHSAAADTYTTISLSHSFAREFDEDEDDCEGSNLYLDRVAGETTSSPTRSPFRLRPRTCHEDEKKQEEADGPSTPPRKQITVDKEGDVQYRCLVRMSPDNYKHEKTSSSEFSEFPRPEETSSVTSSVLLPLHPHQRIIDPFSEIEGNGYPFFGNEQ
jgi:hypothetical protein